MIGDDCPGAIPIIVILSALPRCTVKRGTLGRESRHGSAGSHGHVGLVSHKPAAAAVRVACDKRAKDKRAVLAERPSVQISASPDFAAVGDREIVHLPSQFFPQKKCGGFFLGRRVP